MATINSKELVDEIIANNGYYYEDDRVLKIVEYTNNWGGTSYGIIYKSYELNKYNASDYIHNPKTLWEAK
jgi:hypothetical protein